MKVLITGGMGVNGAVTARLMVQDGLRPVLFDNRMDLTLMGDIKEKVDLVVGDVCDQAALEKIVDEYKITHIAHLAALMPEPAEADPRLGIKVGVDGTVNVLEVARAKNIKRVVFTSSKAAYGEIGGEYAPPTCKPVREDFPKRPADLYGSIKVCCEEVGRYYRETYGIEFIALRFVSIYGPGKEARHGPLSFYGQLIEKAREGAQWIIPQGGDQLNDAVYVGDVARSVYLALKAPAPGEWTFNIGTGKAWTPREFLTAAAKLFPHHKIELGPGPSKLGRSKQSYCVFDISAAKKHLGYEPAYDVERGVRDYVATLDRLGR
ncbi:MAG: NAD(P)-dependent oxidoreductase [Deltaproteobacteria bacterium]|nr:NAD(P)-dependent oxidoreductase [Deltaproteobacteria bacterium]MBI3064648.1 NAD(P)-dependent oxidoreductase [Deltaproteobacteria bacterium]